MNEQTNTRIQLREYVSATELQLSLRSWCNQLRRDERIWILIEVNVINTESLSCISESEDLFLEVCDDLE